MTLYPEKKLAQLILQNSLKNKIKDVVISPGSRNAPLIIGFVNHPFFNTYKIVDERSAAFFALGIAQQKREPVILLCTSGSALLNYYPAIAEAYYSRIPLIVISTDRPSRLIDVGDGQTIRQENVYTNHILFSANLKELEDSKDDLYKEENEELIALAIQESVLKSGPVHINVPFDEPLYNTTQELYNFGLLEAQDEKKGTLLDEEPIDVEELQVYADIWNSAKKKIVLIGSSFPDDLLQTQMNHLIKDPSVLIMTETISNLHNNRFVNCIDQLVFPMEESDWKNIRPEILITFGGMVVSKRIKQILRKYPPKHHWHIDKNDAPNTYFCLTKHFPITAQLFFSQFFFLTKANGSDFQQNWLNIRDQRSSAHQQFLEKVPYSDFWVFDQIFKYLPDEIQLQLSNSSVVRYCQLFNLRKRNKVFCNRGTSGIDGSTSTAVGAALKDKNQTVFITGDISFFYDSNGLWNDYLRKDFRIILINNGGGGIFRILPGPKKSNALDFFETSHKLTAEQLCAMHGIDYKPAEDKDAVKSCLVDFFKPSDQTKLLEIFTPKEENDLILKQYFETLKKI